MQLSSNTHDASDITRLRKCSKMLFSPPMATWLVSFLDLDGVRHSVEVQAEGLYEAAVLGLATFKKHDLDLNPA